MEQWKKIKGYYYSVSNLGRVRNDEPYRRTNRNPDGILKPKKNKWGYFWVGLYKNGKRKYFFFHRLVAIAFIPNTKNKPYINHKNLIKTDNRVENLEWCTQKENIQHAIKNGIQYGLGAIGNIWNCGSKHSQSKLKEDQVLKIRYLYNSNNYTQLELAKMFNICRRLVNYIINRKRWKHI